MNTKETLKDIFRPIKNLIYAASGYAYDMYRFSLYAGWRKSNRLSREYRAVKIYHRLEKSLSFKNRKTTSGKDAALDLIKFINEEKDPDIKRGFQEAISIKVLKDFITQLDSDDPRIEKARLSLAKVDTSSVSKGGIIHMTKEMLQKGILENPENFFLSRFSVRDFKTDPIPFETIKQIIKLASKSPSVCSRQAWHIYFTCERALIDEMLSHQNGNKGFGHNVPCLFVITSDLAAFDTSSERYQYWIDGGMFSMSVLLAIHSLGLGACCLNWSKDPLADIKFKGKFNIRKNHSIIMMMAIGQANDDFNACYSARRPIEEIFSEIKS